MDQLIELLKGNARLSNAELAVMLGKSEEQVAQEIAQQISSFDQVEAVRLMSGTYDIIVEVTGKNIRDISLFVSQRLAAIDAVQETTTHFGLRVYKDNGIIIGGEEKDERGMF